MPNCEIFLVPRNSLFSLLGSTERGDNNAFQVAGAIVDWEENTPAPRCIYCLALFNKKDISGWVIITGESYPTAIAGICPQCIDQKDLLNRALKRLEAETDLVVEVDHRGRA
jgi:hypothetical protein